MDLYLDTSALMKLYLEEPESDVVRASIGAADACVTSVAAYPEARAALAAAGRDRRLDRRGLARAVEALDADWATLGAFGLTRELALAAGALAEQYRLRGYDSVHLATYLHIARGKAGELRFLCFDRAHSRAAAIALRQVVAGNG
jgi:uncharacterized protein